MTTGTLEARQPGPLTWIAALPGIVEDLRRLLEDQKRFEADFAGTAPWSRDAREVLAGDLCIIEEGNPSCGPYRLTVTAMSGEPDGENLQEPLLKLEIRPSPLWVNEVKRLAASSSPAGVGMEV